jgi:UDP-GlcNAc:undecaprenyl-phosphate GlcNAc-1-phosphate transferase
MMIISAILFKYYNDWALLTFYAAFSALIISAFVIADRTGFQFQRYPLIDDSVKGSLRRIKDNHWVIRISFGISKISIPLLLLLFCLIPAKIPGYVSIIVICFGLLIVVVRLFAKKHMGFCLRFVIYLTIPLVLYLIEERQVAWISAGLFNLYHLTFGLIAFFVLLTVKFSRRTKGFRMTTMDFLIIFIAVVVPNLPDQLIQSNHLGLLTVEIIVLLFSFEVLITEFREKFNALTASTLIALILIGIRGVTGF